MNSARNARSIPHTGLIRASGNDRVAQNDEPEPFTEAQLLAGDVANNVDKNQRWHERNDRRALEVARLGGKLL